MAVVAFPSRNKLAYPAGTRAGFNPAHPAAQNCSFSGIAANGGIFINVLSGTIGSSATGPSTSTTSLYGPLGSITNYVATADNSAFPFTSPANVPVTLASIFKITGPSKSLPSYLLNTASASAAGIGWDVLASGNFSFVTGAQSTTDTGIAVSFEKPYFYAASFNGTSVINWVIRRLDTGGIRTGPTTSTDAITVGDGSIWVGNRGANGRELEGGMATAMASTAFMSQSQLNAWAESPWEFWYPQAARSRVAAAAAATFLAAWAQQTNLPVLGTGTY